MPGELYIGGASLARGYLNRPELTAERFVEDDFSDEPGARLYRTGDRVRWLADGTLAFLGRLDHQVKLRGFRIELGEIEAVLLRHPSVAACTVTAREDAPGDQSASWRTSSRPTSPGPEPAALRDFLAERLPHYMVPAHYVRLPAMPLTPNGKDDRRALPAPESHQPSVPGTAPRNPVEELIAGIWADVLRRRHVDVHEDFFELGGHSLLATQVMARIATSLSVALPLRSLFEAPTVAGLAELSGGSAVG